jgi:hypothetical protein
MITVKYSVVNGAAGGFLVFKTTSDDTNYGEPGKIFKLHAVPIPTLIAIFQDEDYATNYIDMLEQEEIDTKGCPGRS